MLHFIGKSASVFKKITRAQCPLLPGGSVVTSGKHVDILFAPTLAKQSDKYACLDIVESYIQKYECVSVMMTTVCLRLKLCEWNFSQAPPPESHKIYICIYILSSFITLHDGFIQQFREVNSNDVLVMLWRVMKSCKWQLSHPWLTIFNEIHIRDWWGPIRTCFRVDELQKQASVFGLCRILAGSWRSRCSRRLLNKEKHGLTTWKWNIVS